MKNLIPQQTQQYFNQIYSSLSRDQLKVLNDILDEIFLKIGFVSNIANSHEIVKQVQTIFREKTATFSDNDKVVLKRSLVAKLVLNLPVILEKMNLPKSIIDLYPDAFRGVANKLQDTTAEPHSLTDDFLLRDLRFALGLSIPCSPFFVDMNLRIRFSRVIYEVLRNGDLNNFIRYVYAKGYGPWFRLHLDARCLEDYNEKGRDESFLRIAELLERRDDIRGIVGTGWLYDPQILEISPHLAYIQKRFIERGAFRLIGHSPTQRDIEFAIEKSKTRRRLYQEKKYIPKIYSIVWPRKELICWAEQARRIK